MEFIKFSTIILLAIMCCEVFGDPIPDPAPLAAPDPGKQQPKISAPEITEAPRDLVVKRNDVARLDCRANGYPAPEFHWLKDGKPFDMNDGDAMLTPFGEVIFMSVSRSDEGTYQCVAKNTVGQAASRNATLKVASLRGDFRTTPKDIAAAVGEIAIMECVGPKGVPEPTISWKKDGRTIRESKRLQVKAGNLLINDAQKSDSGTYVCVATNIADSKESISAILRVEEPPKFTAKPQDVTLKVGDDLNLVCQASGDPRPRINWSKKEGILNRQRMVPMGSGNLRITNVQPEDEGSYICNAINGVGRITATAEVTVQTLPQYTRFPEDKSAPFGSVITLPCAATGSPKPVIIWHTNGGPNMFIENTYEDGHIIVNSDGDLTIYNVKFEDSGMYTCQAVSPVGQITKSAKLQVVHARESEITPPLIKQGPRNGTFSVGETIQLSCETSSLPIPEVAWFINDRKVMRNDDKYVITAAGMLRVFEAQVRDTGLYKCLVSNEYGQSSWTANIQVKAGVTSPPIIIPSNLPGPPSAPYLINTTSSSIAVGWKASTFPGASSVRSYILQYYCIQSSESSWSTVDETILQPLYVLKLLNPASNYVFVVRAVNSHGVSDPSPQSTQIKTKDISSDVHEDVEIIRKQLSSADVTLSVAKAGDDELRLSWETELNCDAVDGFMIISQPVSIRKGELTTYATSCFVRSYNMQNLSPGITYEIRIRPYKGDVTGSPSQIILASLESGGVKPFSPDFSAKSLEDSSAVSAKFNWSPPADIMQEYVTQYIVRCHDNSLDFDKIVHVNSSVRDIIFNDLPPETHMYASVTYVTQLGEGMKSAVREFTTPVFVSTVDDDGIFAMLQNPAILVALVVIVLIIIGALILIIYCYRKKKNKKSRGLHGRPSAGYAQGFKIVRNSTKESSIHGNGTTQSEASSNYTVSHGNNNKQRHDTTTSTDNGKGYPDINHSTTVPHGAGPFSYVTDQLTNATHIPPQFSSPHLQHSSPAGTPEHIPFQTFRSGEEPMDNFSRQNSCSTHNTTSMQGFVDEVPPSYGHVAPDLPPPPPSPPLSQKTSFTNRSRGSSCKNSGSERQSSHSRERMRRNRNQIPAGDASVISSTKLSCGRPTDTDTGIDSPQQTPSPPRPNDLRLANGQYQAPRQHYNGYNPPQREQYQQRPVKQGIALQYAGEGYLAGPSEGETECDFDGVQRHHRPINNHLMNFKDNHRESVAVSGVSMMGEIGSESENSCGRTSPVSSDESIGMESASQVGMNPHLVMGHPGNAFVPIKGYMGDDYHHGNNFIHSANTNQYEPQKQRSHKKHKQQPHHHTAPLNKLYQANPKPHQYKRINSASSSESSYQQNTADSGLSAGVGSLGHNSIHSSSSHGSVTKMPRSRTSDQINNPQHHISEGVDYSSLGRTGDPSRQQINHETSKTPHRITPQDSGLLYSESDREPMLAEDQRYPDDLNDESRSKFLKMKSIFSGGEISRQPELPGVPEATTSDFCEDYSDRSQ